MTCALCHGATDHLGRLEIVTGGSSASAKVFMGQWAEMGEKNWPVGVYRCTVCGHVELFDRSVAPDG